MIVSMRQIEPFNIPPVENHHAALFTKHLTGSETFSFDGDKVPKSMMIYSLKYNYPRHSFANAYLLSIDIDTFDSICSSGRYASMEPIMKQYMIGTIDIEFGGNCSGIEVRARSLRL